MRAARGYAGPVLYVEPHVRHNQGTPGPHSTQRQGSVLLCFERPVNPFCAVMPGCAEHCPWLWGYIL